MIPKNIKANHIRRAIERVRVEGYPAQRASTRFDLVYRGERFPPKVVISYANSFANGVDLLEDEFSGGDEANSFLRQRGFEIVAKHRDVPSRTWIFQANPDLFDIDGYLASETDITWTARQLAGDMRVGDRVFFWRAAGSGTQPAGIVASATITEEPRLRAEDSAGASFWRTGGASKAEVRVRLEVERVATSGQMIKAEWVREDPVLSRLRLLKLRTATNYLLPDDQAVRLAALWANTRRDWNRAESMAGLWAYAKTYGQSVSRAPDGVVAGVALRIGRALSGVYNKVMNFRAIDPRDARAGLAAASKSDYKVWDEFFDEEARELRFDALDAEYARLWSDAEVRVPQSGSSAGTIVVESDDSRGQGYVLDKWKRRAIEVRAMEVAMRHYEARGYAVRDTSASRPYDLLCVRHGEEVRVEVKGTMGAGEKVRVTIGEVANANGGDWRTDLFVVHGIEIKGEGRAAAGEGGAARVVEKWSPMSADLRPLTFEYQVPSAASIDLEY